MTIDHDLLRRYRTGNTSDAETVTVEVELQRSPEWREALNTQVDPAQLRTTWVAITTTIDAPRPARIERLVVRLGLPEHVARVMGATPNLRRAWLVAAFVLLLLGVGAANNTGTDQELTTFLSFAPLIPVLGVGLVYGPGADPAHEMAVVTPMAGLRLVLLRSLVAVATSIVLAGLAALLVDQSSVFVVAWLLPALALPAVTLALASYVPVRVAAGIVAGGWILAVFVAGQAADDGLAAFRVPGQIAAVVVLIAAAIALVARRNSFAQLSVAT